MASDGPKKKVHKERLSTCSYCPMTFKKLEHAQRHERTHTLDRPYSCDTCGKTFARQDTLHRHTRLHSRTEDEGPAGKGPKKRRASTSSAKPSTSNAPKSPKPSSSSSSSGSSSSKPLPTKSSNKVNPNSKQDETFSASSAAFGLSISLPVHPPSFPAYSQPETFLSHNSTTSSHNADFPSIGNSNSIDPSVLPLYSRLGDVGTNSNYGNRIPTRRASHTGGATQVLISSAIGGGGGGTGGGNGGNPTVANGGMSRPRALTLAGLPESFGCFSLINSPASSTASLSLDEEDDEDDDEYRDSSMEEDPIAEEKQDPTWTVDSPSFPPAPESHYPSPAFTSYSPSDLHTDSLTDLQAILDNDPVPSNSFGKSQSRRRRATHQVGGTQLAAVPEPDFDFEAFAASIEGAAPSSGLAPGGPHHRSLSYDEILMQKNGGGGNLFDRYPTPPTDTIPTLPLPTSNDNEFEWLHQYTASAEAQQQAREDAAATAAMFSRGFGLDPSQTTTSPSSSSSALGLNLGLPSPPLTAMAMHAHTVATTSSSPHFSLPISTSLAPPTQGQGVFSNLAQTYASTYPTFSLSAPHATIVPTPLQSALASHSSISIATTEPGTDSSTTSPSLHDLLAAAWERRQRQPSSSQSTTTNPILPASINLKSPFASSSATSPQAKQTPAFYIPSAMHSSAAQIGTATNVDSQAMTVSASGPLSLPIPTWAN